MVGVGSVNPKVMRWQHCGTGSGLPDRVRRRGDLLKTPREEVRCESTGQPGPERVGKDGTEAHEGEGLRYLTIRRPPRLKALEGPRGRRESGGRARRRGAVGSQRPTASSGHLPRRHNQPPRASAREADERCRKTGGLAGSENRSSDRNSRCRRRAEMSRAHVKA